MNKIKMKQELAGNETIYEFFSPGRINLIGEHIDYVGGLVVPAAINLGITAFATKSDIISIKSIDFGEEWITEQNFNFNLKYNEKNGFMNYVYGCLIELQKEFGSKIKVNMGFKLILSSTIPIASGLSSSAAFGVLILEVMNTIYNLKLSKVQKAIIFQRVENNFNGLQSGIMDQFAISLGKKDMFIELNTSSLEYKYVHAKQADYRFILISSNKKRELVDSSYNQRVNELKKVAAMLKLNFNDLHKATIKDIDNINDTVLKKRIRHVVTEVYRVNKIVENLSNMKGTDLGNILNQAHDSLSNDYEVSCDELDFIHNSLLKNKDVYGSRMIGAGFGGCILVTAKKDFDIDSINFNNDYKQKFGYSFDVYEFFIDDGVRVVNHE